MSALPETRTRTAALSMVVAMLVIGFIDIYVAVIAETIGVWQFLVARMMLAMPLVAFLSWIGFGKLRPKSLSAVTIRSVLLATGMFCYFGALGFMPIAMAVAGLFTSPIFVLLISTMFLGKRIGVWRIGATLLGFVGILVVLGPSGQSLGWIVLMPVVGGFFWACGVIATRELCAKEETLSLLTGLLCTQAVMGVIALVVVSVAFPTGDDFLLRGFVWPFGEALPFVLMQSVGAIIGVGLLNRAYLLGEASHVAVYEYTLMIFAPLFGWFLLGQPVSQLQGVGIAMIAAAGIVIALRSKD